MSTFGEVLAHEVKYRKPRRFPWERQQAVLVTAKTHPGRLSDGNLGNPKKDTMLIHGNLMGALGTMQSKFPGRTLQVKTIDTRPAWVIPVACEMCGEKMLPDEQIVVSYRGVNMHFCPQHTVPSTMVDIWWALKEETAR